MMCGITLHTFLLKLLDQFHFLVTLPQREGSQEAYLLKKGWVNPEASLCISKITCLLRGSHQHSHILQYIALTM